MKNFSQTYKSFMNNEKDQRFDVIKVNADPASVSCDLFAYIGFLAENIVDDFKAARVWIRYYFGRAFKAFENITETEAEKAAKRAEVERVEAYFQSPEWQEHKREMLAKKFGN